MIERRAIAMRTEWTPEQVTGGDPFADEVPAGYSDADIEQRGLEQLGRASAAAKARGECPHGWRQGEAGHHGRPRDDDPATCLDCGKRATEGELNADRDRALGH